MSSVKVVDLQNETASGSLNSNRVGVETVDEEVPMVENIEDSKEAIDTFIANEVVEEGGEVSKEETKEEMKEEPKEEKPKRQTQKDKIQCPKCLKEVSIKTYKYSHDKICQGQLSERPVKPHSKPKPKPKPKIATQEIYEDEENNQPREVKFKLVKPPPQPVNPLTNIQQHYQLLQQQYIKQKQEKYNNLCSNMFTTKSKKR